MGSGCSASIVRHAMQCQPNWEAEALMLNNLANKDTNTVRGNLLLVAVVR